MIKALREWWTGCYESVPITLNGIPRIPSRTIALDDAFVKHFGPDEAEFIPDVKLVKTSDALYSVCSVFAEIPEPDEHRSQLVEVRLTKQVGDERIGYTLRLRRRGIIVEFGDEFPVFSAVEGWKQ